MHNGRDGDGPSNSPGSLNENVFGTSVQGGFTQTAAMDVISNAQECPGKEKLSLRESGQAIEFFRRGECTRFQASSRVFRELEGWAGVTDEDRERAFESYRLLLP